MNDRRTKVEQSSNDDRSSNDEEGSDEDVNVQGVDTEQVLTDGVEDGNDENDDAVNINDVDGAIEECSGFLSFAATSVQADFPSLDGEFVPSTLLSPFHFLRVFQSRTSDFIRGFVRPSIRPLVRPWVGPSGVSRKPRNSSQKVI